MGSRPESVASGRTLDEVATKRAHAGARRRRNGPRARKPAAPKTRKSPLPDFVEPELATLTDEAPAGEDWLHEVKLDGYRILCRVDGGHVRLLSRRENDWTDRLPDLVRAASALPVRRALLDGEIAVVLPTGTRASRPCRTGCLACGAAGSPTSSSTCCTWTARTSRRCRSRRGSAVSRSSCAPAGTDAIVYNDHVVGSGPAFYAEACGKGLEGIVSKRQGRGLPSGAGRDWLKVKCRHEQEVVIGGYTPPQGSRVGRAPCSSVSTTSREGSSTRARSERGSRTPLSRS